MTNHRRMVRRLAAVTVLLGMLAIATAAPAMMAEPLGATLGISTATQYWAGHPTCGVPVDITLGGDVMNVGGYESKLTFNAARLGYTASNITRTSFLSDGGTRSTSGASGTPLLEAVGAGNVKFGDYSWGTNAGADAPGTLAKAKLDVVSCGSSNLSLSETQVVDYQGNLFALTSQATNVPVKVNHRLNVNGDAIPVVTGQDVLAVVNALNSSVACTAGYQYNTNGDAIPVVTGQDVLAVVNALNSSVACP